MNRQEVSLPSDPTRQDQLGELIKRILASVTFLLMGVDIVLVGFAFFASAWCSVCFEHYVTLALMTLPFIAGGTFLMFSRRYGLALPCMALPSVARLILMAAG